MWPKWQRPAIAITKSINALLHALSMWVGADRVGVLLALMTGIVGLLYWCWTKDRPTVGWDYLYLGFFVSVCRVLASCPHSSPPSNHVAYPICFRVRTMEFGVVMRAKATQSKNPICCTGL